MAETRYLRKMGEDHLYIYTEELMKRGDMEIVLSKTTAPSPAPSSSSVPTTDGIDPNKIVALVEAMESLKDPDDFTSDGRPKVEVLSTLMGVPVTGKERDMAFDEYNKKTKG